MTAPPSPAVRPLPLPCVVGARPNFVKMAPVLAALTPVLAELRPAVRPVLVHTGQHYDPVMSDLFFEQLRLPRPEVHLEVGSGTHGRQTARVLERFEEFLEEDAPDAVATLVVGDVNSTLAATLASIKRGVPVIHVEAGLRSFDRAMPEELNRVLTDAVSELLLVSEPAGVENLRREGRPDAAIRLVGNVMIDALHTHLPAARATATAAKLGLDPAAYALWTLHRPANVDDPAALARFMGALTAMARRLPVVFPLHPRTRARLEDAGLLSGLADAPGVHLLEPLGYLEFLGLSADARVVVTDSGGIQEETTALGIPCLTLRANTERPITVTEGTNTLIGDDLELLERHLEEILAGEGPTGRCPELWDGKASERIAREVAAFLERRRAEEEDKDGKEGTGGSR